MSIYYFISFVIKQKTPASLGVGVLNTIYVDLSAGQQKGEINMNLDHNTEVAKPRTFENQYLQVTIAEPSLKVK
ncbi:hypothetical protein AZI09_12120 (plasmid) [Levilactobacillus brevis]|nr:hypothetical protein L747_00550 [Levilactobacillus brevis BSO 464]ARN91232.1 hypothetical protein AZI09_12120 [Levilactobacillus brevis]